ncbi:hypothetical protein HCN08_30505 [Streptomyces sp. PRB2-1]|uniref:MaoC-like domain-containing protein n=2 Tax=Actinacidiphila epipremni TaxID=2053013 RepID=A0ABX0ZUK7_9ACTN|nr:hypothetical protein [Actinacidiphila epipremni]
MRLAPARLTRRAVRVDPARLAAYARVCGFPPGPALPLTYPHVLAFPLAARLMSARSFPLPLLGLVHTSLTITARAPLPATDRPDLHVSTQGLRPHPRGTEVTLVTEATLAGELIWHSTSTYLSRHKPPDPPTPDPPTPEPPTPDRPTPEPGVPEPAAPAPSDAGPGSPLPTVATWQLDAALGRRYARVTGDFNPIHLSPLTARPFGFPRAIAHGMCTAAQAAAQRPEATSLHATFHRAVLLPSTVEYATAASTFELRSPLGTHVRGTMSA